IGSERVTGIKSESLSAFIGISKRRELRAEVANTDKKAMSAHRSCVGEHFLSTETDILDKAIYFDTSSWNALARHPDRARVIDLIQLGKRPVLASVVSVA